MSISSRLLSHPARTLICVAGATIIFAGSPGAQDPFVVAPQAYKVQFENDWVRVVHVHYAPFEKLPAHDHPKGRTIFVYLNDGGRVRFKHVEGYSGNYAAVRPPTKAGAFRLAGVQPENHEVENLSDLPSEFLQVELRTEAPDPKSFHGRYVPEPRSAVGEGNYRKVEFDNEQVRITRSICASAGNCEPLGPSPYPSLLIALSPLEIGETSLNGKADKRNLGVGQTVWLEPSEQGRWNNSGATRAEQLLIEFKSKPTRVVTRAVPQTPSAEETA
jgi:hypothetical protein